MTPHISAKLGEIAKTVFLPGDPLRAKFIAENYLDNAKLVSDVRGMLYYTGTYKGKEVTVGSSGMGLGSMGIYSFELFSSYGVERIVRIGTTGSYLKDLKNYDLVLPEESVSDCVSFSKHNLGFEVNVVKPSKDLNLALEESAARLGIKLSKGRVHSTDVFYDVVPMDKLVEETESICVEMESYSLFVVAQRLNKQAACLLTVSNNLVTNEETTHEEREKSLTNMVEVVLGIL